MKFSKSMLVLLVLVLAMSAFLVACGKDKEEETATPTDTTTETPVTEQPKADEPVKGGVVTFAMFSAPKGIFNPIYSEDLYESNIYNFAFESLWDLKDDLSFGPMLADTWEFSEDYKDLTVKLRQDVKWHDGVQFTADDVVYTYTAIADPKYTGPRVSVVSTLTGYQDYFDGKITEFKGIEKVDDYTVVFHFTEAIPNAIANTNYVIIPKHVYENVSQEAMPSAPESTDFSKLVGNGPFKFDKAVANESYELVRNDEYFRGAPYLDKIVYKIVSADVAAGLFETGEIDAYMEISPDDYEVIKGLPKIAIHETPDFGYQYMGILLSKRPADAIKNMDYSKPETWTPNEKLANKSLRQAMAYAINRQGIVDGFLGGHGTVMNAPMPPVSWAAATPDQINTYPYDPEKAKQVLEEAGYKDTDGDGFREDPAGKKLEFKLDYPTGNPVREKSAPIIAENLQAVGLNVKANSPRDVGAHYDNIDIDGAELFLAGWSLDTDPDPRGIWETNTPWNFPRWVSEESMQLMKDGISLAAFDQEYRKNVYVKWQQLVNDELPYIFLYTANTMQAYNTDIQNIQKGTFGITRDPHLWWRKQ